MSRPPDRQLQGASTDVSRLFFALWPEAALRASIAEQLGPVIALLDGALQRPDQWHVTLEFLGAVPRSRIPDVQQAAAAVRAEPFELTLERIDYWRRSGILCLVTSRQPPALDRLVAALRAELAVRGFEPERRPFHAHLTLARRAPLPRTLPVTAPLRWPAAGFALVESNVSAQGSVYTPLATWPLEP